MHFTPTPFYTDPILYSDPRIPALYSDPRILHSDPIFWHLTPTPRFWHLTPTPRFHRPHFTADPTFRPHVSLQLQVSDPKFTLALYSDPRILM